MPKVTRSRPRNSLATWNQTTRCLESEPEEMMTSQRTQRSGGTGSGLPGVLIHHPASPGRGAKDVSSTYVGKGRIQPQKKKRKGKRRPCSILVESSFPFEDPQQALGHLPSTPASPAEATGKLHPASQRVTVLQHLRQPPPPTTTAARTAILNRPSLPQNSN